MAKPIEPLPAPIQHTTDFGTVTLTHKAYGFTFRPWEKPKVVSYHVLGILKSGAFMPFAGTEVYAKWTNADMQELNRDGATLQEILSKHDEIVIRDS
jgi:hypothetical protein